MRDSSTVTESEAEELAKEIYARDGFLSVGFRFNTFEIGDIVPNNFEDEHLGKYRWRVSALSSAEECRRQSESVGVAQGLNMVGRKFYRLEAMD